MSHRFYPIGDYGYALQSNTSNINSEDFMSEIYALLVHFSSKIQVIKEINHHISLQLDSYSTNWNSYIQYFELGSYFHYRCQGYIESLKVTNVTSQHSINVWVNQLVYPAAENFKLALSLYERFNNQAKHLDETIIRQLDQQISEFKVIAQTIIQRANALNQLSPSISL
jgi:hypothetical protein